MPRLLSGSKKLMNDGSPPEASHLWDKREVRTKVRFNMYRPRAMCSGHLDNINLVTSFVINPMLILMNYAWACMYIFCGSRKMQVKEMESIGCNFASN